MCSRSTCYVWKRKQQDKCRCSLLCEGNLRVAWVGRLWGCVTWNCRHCLGHECLVTTKKIGGVQGQEEGETRPSSNPGWQMGICNMNRYYCREFSCMFPALFRSHLQSCHVGHRGMHGQWKSGLFGNLFFMSHWKLHSLIWFFSPPPAPPPFFDLLGLAILLLTFLLSEPCQPVLRHWFWIQLQQHLSG